MHVRMGGASLCIVLVGCCARAAAAGVLVPESGVFVHLFEWSWADVARECEEWLGPKGYTAVQVSPPNEHIVGEAWWTRYQPVTYNLTSRSGSEAGFTDMVRRCRSVGVDIYADAVCNHIAAGSGMGIAGSAFGDRTTPIYQQNDMHHSPGDAAVNCQISNYQDKYNVQYCDLDGLPDLCTSCPNVQERIYDYLSYLASLDVAGIRVDAAKHMDATELWQITSRVSDRLFIFQEVIRGFGEAVQPEMYTQLGRVTEFNYARQLAPNLLAAEKLHYLETFGESWGFLPSHSAVVFLDNHDTQRGEAGLTYKSGKLYEFANVFMLAHPFGYPKVMSSYDFNDHDQGPPKVPVHENRTKPACRGISAPYFDQSAPWICEHRSVAVANMVAWRRTAGSAPVENFEAPGDQTIAFCRGGAACVALNRQESTIWLAELQVSVPPGTYCDVIQSDDTATCATVEVSGSSVVKVQVPPLSAVAFHIGKRAAPQEARSASGPIFE